MEEVDSSSSEEDVPGTHQLTEIDAAIDEGAAELQRLRDRRKSRAKSHFTADGVNIVPTASGRGGMLPRHYARPSAAERQQCTSAAVP